MQGTTARISGILPLYSIHDGLAHIPTSDTLGDSNRELGRGNMSFLRILNVLWTDYIDIVLFQEKKKIII